MSLTDIEKREVIELLKKGETLPERWRYRLFPGGYGAQETGKEYRLVYDGKLKREEVLAQTPAAPWQLVARVLHGSAARGRLAKSCWCGGTTC